MKTVRDTDLAVRGVKIDVQQQQNPGRRITATCRNTSYNQFRVCSAVVSRGTVAGKSNFAEYREAFKLKTVHIPKSAVETRQLRRIRESVDIGDLRGLLESFGDDLREVQSGDASDSGNIVTCIDASKVYKEFYQVHYDFLKDVVERMSLQ